MKRNVLNPNVRNQILSVIKNSGKKCNNESIVKQIKAKLEMFNLFYSKLATNNYKEILYMYHDLDIDMLASFCKISLIEEEHLEMYKDSKIILKRQYILNMKILPLCYLYYQNLQVLKLSLMSFFLNHGF